MKNTIRPGYCLVLSIVSCGALLVAQPKLPILKSPEVHPDSRVSFRVRAPNAKVVRVAGTFGPVVEMKRDDDGVWSATIGPLAPEIYSYNFEVDGAAFPDPSRYRAQAALNGVSGSFDIPGHPAAIWAERDVPHGTLHWHTYKSKSLGLSRRYRVYTPPGYDSADGKLYPVLYLLHGAGGDETTWTDNLRADRILDNFIAVGKAVPTVVVMPMGHTIPNTLDRSAPWRAKTHKLFDVELTQDLMPLVEKQYRVKQDAKSRAIAGLSMGAVQALLVGLNHLDLFSYFGSFSSAISKAELESNFTKLSADPAFAKKQIRLLWLGCGTEDEGHFGATKRFSEFLKQQNIDHVLHITPGDHTWDVFRNYFVEFAPRMFR